jgi:hypothetical protein
MFLFLFLLFVYFVCNYNTKDNDNENHIFDIALRHEYTPIVNVTRNREINILHSIPDTSASTNIRKTSNSTTNRVGTT